MARIIHIEGNIVYNHAKILYKKQKYRPDI